MTLFVAGLMALAIWLLTANRPFAAGVALALATIKPQLVAILLLWLLVWTLADLRGRFRWLVSFVCTLAALFAASEYYLPHWLPRFFEAVRDYRSYADAVFVFDKLIPAPWSTLLVIVVGAATVDIGWKGRTHAANTLKFADNAAFLMAVTVILIPSYALYNQMLLVPAVLGLMRERRALWHGGAIRRGLLFLLGLLVLWPWTTCILLAANSFFLPPEAAESAWAVPLWTSLMFPVGVAALMLLSHVPRAFDRHEKAAAS
jgi:hypothetical protein